MRPTTFVQTDVVARRCYYGFTVFSNGRELLVNQAMQRNRSTTLCGVQALNCPHRRWCPFEQKVVGQYI